MRRFVTLLVLMLVSVPFGISISGCGKKTAVTFCNASSGDGGVVVGQLNSIVLQPVIYGISLNYGQIGQLSTPSGTDCKGTAVTVRAFTYGSQNVSIVDVNPATGALCAGTWNRNLNVIPDFTVCTPPTNPNSANSMTYLTAEANGVTSNPIPVYTHPIVTSVVIGTATTNCSTDPTTNCCPLAASNTITAPAYDGVSCVSQQSTAQLVARVFSGTGASLQNISCQAGHLTFAAQTGGIVTIDQNGVATAQLPGSSVITASVANAGSSAGFFSTCPPTSIQLSVPNSSSTNITVNQNFAQPLVATALDAHNPNHIVTLTGLPLEFVSTTPTTIPVAASGIVTPSFPGGASITAICQPPTCNPSPFNQIGLNINGKPVTSNPVDVTTPGTNSTLLYLASTQSRYLVPVDFTTTTLGTPVQLPFVPNSMVISQDGTSIYMGSTQELMVVSATTDGISGEFPNVPGTVLAVSPDNATVVISDSVRKLIYLETAGGVVSTQYGAVGTHAQWTPDSQTVYITAADPATGVDQLLVYSTFTGWNNITTPIAPTANGNFPLDVAVTVPSVGAYFAGSQTTAVGYCPASTTTTTNGQTTVANTFNPLADTVGTTTDRIAATNDGRHILGATASTKLLSDLQVTIPIGPCPLTGGLQFSANGTSTPFTTTALSGISPTSITGVFPASDSSTAVVTYLGTGGLLPVYAPSATGKSTPGTLTSIPLSGSALAPIAGVWSTDNLTFYAGTSGDNLVHLITRASSTSPLADSKTIAPNLPGLTGGTVAPNLIVQKPRKTT
jgi:hypothetical protein